MGDKEKRLINRIDFILLNYKLKAVNAETAMTLIKESLRVYKKRVEAYDS